MNSQTGKLLVLGGCGINAVTILLNLLWYVAPINFLTTLISLASIAGLASIVAGFLILFLCDKSILDLVIAGGFGISLITSAVAFAINMNLLSIPFDLYFLNAINTISLIAFLAWGFKLIKKGQIIAACALFGALTLTALHSTVSAIFGADILVFLSIVISIVEAGALAFAAFMDYQS